MRAQSTRSWATGSWLSSAHRLRMRTMRSGPATQPSTCRPPFADMPRRHVAPTVSQLRFVLGQTSGGHGQVVAIAGEPGVGKSRLVWEVTHSHRLHGWLVLQASSVSYGRATSYLPVIDLLKTYFAIEDRDGPRAMREKLTGK